MSKNEKNNKKSWPQNCIWPKPLESYEGMTWEEDWIDYFSVDETVQELLDVKEYFDQLVEEGSLTEDYKLNVENSGDLLSENQIDSDIWTPEKGEDYWHEGEFNLIAWQDDLNNAMNLLKIEDSGTGIFDSEDPASDIQRIIHYTFINENLLRQAFTRRSFAVEYSIKSQLNRTYTPHEGCSEELEFLGDSVLNTVVTKEILKHHAVHDSSCPSAPYQTRFDEGIFSKMRSHFTCKDYLSMRATTLGLDRYILYGAGDTESDHAKEDMMEALIGAVTVDSDWDMEKIEEVIDHLLDLQIECPDSFLKKSYYDIVNAWHQKHFGVIPKYEVFGHGNRYQASIRYEIPDNDKSIYTAQIETGEGTTRSEARTNAAERAYFFIRKHGLWSDLKGSKIEPDFENAIGQLQELFQKKYISELPVYEFEEDCPDHWLCDCYFDSFHAYGRGSSKTKAKKAAAYMGLVRLFQSAGCAKEEWEQKVWDNVLN